MREWLGIDRYHHEEIDSTNLQLHRLAREGAKEGTLVTADMQTAGRGRRGRTWTSQKNAGLYLSFLLRPKMEPEQVAQVTLVAALAVTEALEQLTKMPFQIKWPNDIVYEGKKVCGILTEMQLAKNEVDYLIVGIGINLSESHFDEEVAKKAIWLNNICSKRVDRQELLETVLAHFETCYDTFCKTKDLTRVKADYESHLVNLKKKVRIEDPLGAYEGIAEGISEYGELLVQVDERIVKVNSGEVSVRGIYGYV